MNSNKYILTGKTIDELQEFVISLGEPKFRANQIFEWLYDKRVFDFDEMSNLSKSFREKLKENAEIFSLALRSKTVSKSTGTEKHLLATKDARTIEAVIIPEGKRTTLCISTQVGCPLDCKFCATGLMGFKRNLTSSGIVDQYLLLQKNYHKDITNIVFMGMGEPLVNYNNTLKAIEIFINEKTRGLSKNRITVSTAGITPKIYDLANSGLRIKIALSLHSLFDDIRSKLMPINKKYPIAEILDSLEYYARKTKTRITFEYTMFEGINDRDEDIKKLVKLTRRIPSKINLIPFNSISHMSPDEFSASLKPTPRERIDEFANKLRAENVSVFLRNTQGDDIAAACGQLAIKES